MMFIAPSFSLSLSVYKARERKETVLFPFSLSQFPPGRKSREKEVNAKVAFNKGEGIFYCVGVEHKKNKLKWKWNSKNILYTVQKVQNSSV